MNVRLLRKVKKHILEEPRRFQMDGYVHRGRPGSMFEDLGLRYKVPDCGTVACIAGWAQCLSGGDSSPMEALGLHGYEDRLFFMWNWPMNLRKRFYAAKTMRTRAKIAAERIEHFIKTKGAE